MKSNETQNGCLSQGFFCVVVTLPKKQITIKKPLIVIKFYIFLSNKPLFIKLKKNITNCIEFTVN